MEEACKDGGTGPSTSGGTPALVGKKCSFDAALSLKLLPVPKVQGTEEQQLSAWNWQKIIEDVLAACISMKSIEDQTEDVLAACISNLQAKNLRLTRTHSKKGT